MKTIEKIKADFEKELKTLGKLKYNKVTRLKKNLGDYDVICNKLKELVNLGVKTSVVFKFHIDNYCGVIELTLFRDNGGKFGKIVLSVDGDIEKIQVPDVSLLKESTDLHFFYQDFFNILAFLKTEHFKIEYRKITESLKNYLNLKREVYKIEYLLNRVEEALDF